MLNAEHQFIVHKDHKPVVRFLSVEYHEDIFVRWTNKLHLLNIRIQQYGEETVSAFPVG